MKIRTFDANGKLRAPVESPKVAKSDAEWRSQLTAEQRDSLDTVRTSARVPWSIVKPPRHLLRPVGLLLALCVLAGVLVAGMAFPGALAVGMVSNEAGDSVNSVSTDLATGQLPQTSTITDSAGVPIAYLFDQNRDPVAADRISPAPTPDEEYRRDSSANPPTT